MKKILMINPFGIGDVLFTTPVINAIKDILSHNPQINAIFAFSRGDLKKMWRISKLKAAKKLFDLLWQIRQERFDVCFDFSLDYRYGLMAMLLGIKKRIGYNYKNRGRFLTDAAALHGYTGRHIVSYYLDLLKYIDVVPRESRLSIGISDAARLKCRIELETLGVKDTDVKIGIAPGAGGSWGQSAAFKHWPALKYAQLADRLICELNAKVLVLGDSSEKKIAEIMLLSMRRKPIDLVGKTNLEQLSAVISNLSMLITNDGGPLHMAVALSIPTVSIFGPVDETVYGPFPPSEKHRLVSLPVECRPCYKNFSMSGCERDRECLQTISVEKVFEEARRLL
jgi:lipopolysaccharide heptosyltransferase II